MPPGDPFGDMMNAPKKYVVSKTLQKPQLVHALLAADLVDELHLLLYPLVLGSGKRGLPDGRSLSSG